MKPQTIADTQSSWDDFFVYNPASRHRRMIIKGLLRGLGVPFKKILDIGCGSGRMLEELHAEFKSAIYGMEPNCTSAEERLKSVLNGFYPLDIEKSALDATFDLVMMTEVLEHTEDDAKALANVAKMAGRFLLLTVPAGPVRSTDVTMGHKRHYTAAALRGLAERSGFRTLACFAWGFPFHSIYRALLDVAPGQVVSAFGQHRYGPLQKLILNLIYPFFFLNSSKRGCQLFYLGEKLQADRLPAAR